MSLKGKAALVTGSTSGIGLGIARALAADGRGHHAERVRRCRRRSRLCGLTSPRSSACGWATPAPISASPSRSRRWWRTTEQEFGSLDILVNNAGIQFTANVEDFPVDRWDSVIAINLSGVFHGMKAAIPGMKRRGWGRIINIASAHGLVASAQKVAYVAAKHGVMGMTKVAAIELANHGVTVNAICPGWVLTPLVQKQLEDRARRDGTGGAAEAALPGREAADGAVLHARADRRAGGVPVLRGGQDDHRRAAVDRWRLGGAVSPTRV